MMNRYCYIRIKSVISLFVVVLLLIGSYFSIRVTATKKDNLEENANENENPYVMYSGNTWSNPGDVVTLRGDYLDKIDRIDISRLLNTGKSSRPHYISKTYYNKLTPEDEVKSSSHTQWNSIGSQSVDVLQQTQKSVKFIIPSNIKKGAYSVKLSFKDRSIKTQYLYINSPSVEWIQGNCGSSASLGGWIRIQGSNISIKSSESNVRIALKNINTGKVTKLKPTKVYDSYSIETAIPKSIKAGTYNISLYNGFGSSTCWSIPIKFEITEKSVTEQWPDDVYNVMDYGACGDGTKRENAAFQAALDAAKSNGGGRIYFPSGRYMLSKSFIIPNNVTLYGDKAEETMIFWTGFEWDYNELPEYVLSCARDVEIKNITFSGNRIKTFLDAGDDCNIVKALRLVGRENDPCKNIFINNCRFYFDSTGGAPTLNDTNKNSMSNMVSSEMTPSGAILKITAENVQVDNVEILSRIRPFIIKSYYGYMKDVYVFDSWATFSGSNIWSHNLYGNFTFGTSGYNIYCGDFNIKNHIGNNRETMTTDGGHVGFDNSCSGEAQSDGVTIKFTETKFTENELKDKYLYVSGGACEGQIRKIASNTADTIKIAEPFIGKLDETSWFTASELRDTMYFVNWDVYNSGAFQFYGFTTNAVVDGLKLKRNDGLYALSSPIYKADQINWYISYLNNKMSDCNYYKFYGYDMSNGDASFYVQVAGKKQATSTNICTLFKNNTFTEGGYIKIQVSGGEILNDLVICNNSISDAITAIKFLTNADNIKGMLIYNNNFNASSLITAPESMDFSKKDDNGQYKIESLSTHKGITVYLQVIPFAIFTTAFITIFVLLIVYLKKKKKNENK